MSKKEQDVSVEETEVTPFQFGLGPSLIIRMVRESRIYRFEMPIGAKLAECKEACLECVEVVNKMVEEAERKQAAAEAEAVKTEAAQAETDNKKEE